MPKAKRKELDGRGPVDMGAVAGVTDRTTQQVRGMANTNGVESFWSMLIRAHKGTFHKISPKHLDRYIKEFVGRHSIRGLDTLDPRAARVRGLEGKRLKPTVLAEREPQPEATS
jgi:hypothetical protein